MEQSEQTLAQRDGTEHALTRRTALAGLAAASAGAMLGGPTVTALAGSLPARGEQTQMAAQDEQAPMAARPTMGFVLWHEQFPGPELVRIGTAAERAGFDAVWTSDHFQPWQANDGHADQAWVTLSALSQHTSRLRFGTGVTCPIFRYRPAVVAQAFASLSLFAPGRVFLGLGAGERLNEGASGGGWALYPERAARLIEAVKIIRALWTGQQVTYNGRFWQVQGRLYDPPAQRIPIYIAAGGPKSARLSGMYGDGLIADPMQLMTNPAYKDAWKAGARAAGKNPDTMPILLEHFVVIGDEAEARRDAELVRFQGKAWKPGYFNNISPAAIQRRAEMEIPLEALYSHWPVSTDPAVHVQAIQNVVNAGVTHLFVHSTQQDQVAVVDFFGRQVLPQIHAGAIKGVRQVMGM